MATVQRKINYDEVLENIIECEKNYAVSKHGEFENVIDFLYAINGEIDEVFFELKRFDFEMSRKNYSRASEYLKKAVEEMIHCCAVFKKGGF